MEYKHEVDKDKVRTSNFFSIDFGAEPCRNHEEADADAIVVIESNLGPAKAGIMKMTENDNDNQSSGGGSFQMKRCVRTISDTNHRLKNLEQSPSTGVVESCQKMGPTSQCRKSCNNHNSQCDNGCSSLQRQRRTTTRTRENVAMGTWSRTGALALLSVFLVNNCCGLANAAAATDNYSSGSTTTSNYRNYSSNLADGSQQRSWSDKLATGNKDLAIVDDINLIDGLHFDQDNILEINDNVVAAEDGSSFNDDKEHYTHQWAVHILGGPEVARRVAERHGFHFGGEVSSQNCVFSSFFLSANDASIFCAFACLSVSYLGIITGRFVREKAA